MHARLPHGPPILPDDATVDASALGSRAMHAGEHSIIGGLPHV